jgi:hypothetical protein
MGTRQRRLTADNPLTSAARRLTDIPLAEPEPPSQAPGMFTVSEEEAADIRAVYEQRGELSAAVELRCRFPGIFSAAQARECARIIASWKPLPLRPLRPAH